MVFMWGPECPTKGVAAGDAMMRSRFEGVHVALAIPVSEWRNVAACCACVATWIL